MDDTKTDDLSSSGTLWYKYENLFEECNGTNLAYVFTMTSNIFPLNSERRWDKGCYGWAFMVPLELQLYLVLLIFPLVYKKYSLVCNVLLVLV